MTYVSGGDDDTSSSSGTVPTAVYELTGSGTVYTFRFTKDILVRYRGTDSMNNNSYVYVPAQAMWTTYTSGVQYQTCFASSVLYLGESIYAVRLRLSSNYSDPSSTPKLTMDARRIYTAGEMYSSSESNYKIVVDIWY